MSAINPRVFYMDAIDSKIVNEIVPDGEDIPEKLMKKWKSKYNPNKGDILIPQVMYERDGMHLYTGDEWVPLEEDYHILPSTFRYPEFPLGYWRDNVGPSSWIERKSDIGQLIKKRIKEGKYEGDPDEKYIHFENGLIIVPENYKIVKGVYFVMYLPPGHEDEY